MKVDIPVQGICECGRVITKKEAAKILRFGRKEITSEQAKAMIKAREAKRNK